MGTDVIGETLTRWTRDRDPVNCRISVFEHIRNMPYTAIPDLANAENGPTGLLEGGSGSCTPKAYLLGLMFELMGFDVEYLSHQFEWKESVAAFPPEVRSMAERQPLEYHQNCRVNIDGRWVMVDATWDPPLAGVGFPVNQSWDGFSDARNAVISLGEVAHDSPESTDEYLRIQKAEYSDEEQEAISLFIEVLNPWLESVRLESA